MNLLVDILKHIPPSKLKIAENALVKIASNEPLLNYLKARAQIILKAIHKLNRILVVSDINIGDSVIVQSAIDALRHYFNQCDIDYVYNSKAQTVIGHNPSITTSFPIFHNDPNCHDDNLSRLDNMLHNNHYDLVINFCPFLRSTTFRKHASVTISPIILIANILASYKTGKSSSLPCSIVSFINHIASHCSPHLLTQKDKYSYTTTRIFVPEHAIKERQAYAESKGLPQDVKKVFVNPDTSNRYTLIDPDVYKHIIVKLLTSGKFHHAILGKGITFRGIDDDIYRDIPNSLKPMVSVLDYENDLPLYAALVDISDVCITGDTGLMHIAAAQKISSLSNNTFQNKTAIVTIFKASEPRIYGYDSFNDHIIDSSQEAAAKVFEVKPECKHLSCSLQRVLRSCKLDKCDYDIHVDKIVDYILRVL